MSASEKMGVFVLVAASTLTAPLARVGNVTLTGDRLLGLIAVGVTAGLALAWRLHWTPIHSALALFVAVQIATTLLSIRTWPAGLKLVTIYVLGFATFCVAAEVARRAGGRRRFAVTWMVVGAAMGLVGTVLAVWANLIQRRLWGTGVVQALVFSDPANPRLVMGSKVTFGEWNLFSSFLLIPFALALWRSSSDADARPRRGLVIGCLAAVVLGLAFGFTRAAWVSMAGIIALWWWTRRPGWRQLAALGSMLALAVALQVVAIGASPIEFRVVRPVAAGFDWNMASREAINRATVASWMTRPVLGHGAGSINALTTVLPNGRTIQNIWNGNLVLFVLHDSGVIGFAALVIFAVTVWRRAWRAVRRQPREADDQLALPLLAVGGGLAFAYLFTHGLWLMYPYVYLGLLTAVTGDRVLAHESPGSRVVPFMNDPA